ncbi:MAG: site-specific tyrosine recombinase XerD [Acidithiobacillus caldus]|uniref:site-specific tyrosine recombinase XerD n=1 Tax=Acidithiobacillus caldus TaxID=33059 RepID=UPI001C06E2CE|nr:site-specific tyrosine recombinase XerD [Acidithiobacillus caldus]MBU2790581.1 site-specific tyrosine recombinase XerD [Acidithiobacillus caldus]MBU2820583.1 site-specific tyrosine recombinase XerD [Acidithiobacillus caldus]WMT46645.1 MAG: site-specific tyrosine recombinase XerD [Acidithiobacillus caldus]
MIATATPGRAARDPVDEDLARFLDHLWLEGNLAANSLEAYSRDLRLLATYLAASQRRLRDADAADLSLFLAQRLQGGAALRSVARQLSSLRRFYAFAQREGWRGDDPSASLQHLHIGRHLPAVPSEGEVDALLAAPDRRTVLGLRDAAMLETLYATGLRVSELVGLLCSQLDLEAGVVLTLGKGSKERLIPVGEVALETLNRYLREARGALLGHKQSPALFLTVRGEAMSRQRFWQTIKAHATKAGVRSAFSPHSLRHAFATHLLDHGADLRSVQLMLGHAQLNTTEIYTHIAQARLQNLHRQHHPRG